MVCVYRVVNDVDLFAIIMRLCSMFIFSTYVSTSKQVFDTSHDTHLGTCLW